MSLKTMSTALTVAAAIGAAAMALAGPADASAAARAKSPGVPSPVLAANMPSGYVIVNTGPITIGADKDKRGEADCPTATRPLGGGVFYSATSVHATLNDAYPVDAGYRADISNPTSSASTFTVYAICSKRPTNYAVSQTSIDYLVGAHSQGNDLTLDCRHGKALSGGPSFETRSFAADINSSIPQTPGWRVDANNGTGGTQAVLITLVCATVTGYHVVVGPNVSNPAGAQSVATAMCGTGVPVGGGTYSSSSSTSVAINSSYPVAGGWQSYMNNASSSSASLNTYVVCAS